MCACMLYRRNVLSFHLMWVALDKKTCWENAYILKSIISIIYFTSMPDRLKSLEVFHWAVLWNCWRILWSRAFILKSCNATFLLWLHFWESKMAVWSSLHLLELHWRPSISRLSRRYSNINTNLTNLAKRWKK